MASDSSGIDRKVDAELRARFAREHNTLYDITVFIDSTNFDLSTFCTAYRLAPTIAARKRIVSRRAKEMRRAMHGIEEYLAEEGAAYIFSDGVEAPRAYLCVGAITAPLTHRQVRALAQMPAVRFITRTNVQLA